MSIAKPSFAKLNRKHPLAKGLKAAYLFDHGERYGLGGEVLNISQTTVTSNPTKVSTPWGNGAKFVSGSSQGLFLAYPNTLNLTTVAVAIRFKIDVDPAGATWHLATVNNGSSGTAWTIGLNYDGLTNGSIMFKQTDPTVPANHQAYASAELPGDPANIGKWYDFIGFSNGPGKTFGNYLADPITGRMIDQQITQPYVLGTGTTKDSAFAIGCGSSALSGFSSCTMAHVLIWDGAFDYERAAAVVSDPYAMFRPATPMILTSTGAPIVTSSKNLLTLGVG